MLKELLLNDFVLNDFVPKESQPYFDLFLDQLIFKRCSSLPYLSAALKVQNWDLDTVLNSARVSLPSNEFEAWMLCLQAKSIRQIQQLPLMWLQHFNLNLARNLWKERPQQITALTLLADSLAQKHQYSLNSDFIDFKNWLSQQECLNQPCYHWPLSFPIEPTWALKNTPEFLIKKGIVLPIKLTDYVFSDRILSDGVFSEPACYPSTQNPVLI